MTCIYRCGKGDRMYQAVYIGIGYNYTYTLLLIQLAVILCIAVIKTPFL